MEMTLECGLLFEQKMEINLETKTKTIVGLDSTTFQRELKKERLLRKMDYISLYGL